VIKSIAHLFLALVIFLTYKESNPGASKAFMSWFKVLKEKMQQLLEL